MQHSLKLTLSVFLLSAFYGSLSAQDEKPKLVYWYTLSSIPLEGEYRPNQQPPLPLFPQNVRQLDGQMVAIDGYTIPLDPSGNQITLSANPFSACFFCGKAGPASIMTVLFDEPNKGLKTDDYIYLTGRLRLNSTDPWQPYYTLEHAKLVRKK